MKAHIILMTHAVTNWHLYGKTQGHIDIPLNSYGKKMAEVIAEKLRDESIDTIYTSDLERAYQTALPMAKEKGLDINKRSDLREGRWKVNSNSAYQQLAFHCEYENIDMLKTRIVNVITQIAEDHLGQKIVIISHEGAVKQFTKFIGDTSEEHFLDYKGVRSAVNRFEYEDGHWHCLVLNDRDFLREVPKSSIRFRILYFILEMRMFLIKTHNKAIRK